MINPPAFKGLLFTKILTSAAEAVNGMARQSETRKNILLFIDSLPSEFILSYFSYFVNRILPKNIYFFFMSKNLKAKKDPEKAGLSTDYRGMLGRGEKLPALETFLKIANAIEIMVKHS